MKVNDLSQRPDMQEVGPVADGGMPHRWFPFTGSPTWAPRVTEHLQKEKPEYQRPVLDGLARHRPTANPFARKAQEDEYAQLRRLVQEHGLLDKQPLYYAWKIVSTLALLVAGLSLLVLLDSPWLRMINAAFLAFVFTQIGFLAHDLGHGQVFSNRRSVDMVFLPFTLILGISSSWWVKSHNIHHRRPNQASVDPGLKVPLVAYTPEQAASKRGLARFLVKFQAFYFPLLLAAMESMGMRILSIRYLLKKQTQYHRVELLLIAGHWVVYLGALLYLIGPWEALLFFVIHQGLFGLYIGMVMAPNHTDMPILENDSGLDYVQRQVLTARNINSHPLLEFVYGGLNFHIEHHLFPTMSRNKLRAASAVVQEYCHLRDISYSETGTVRAFIELFRNLHIVGAPLRLPYGGR